jgi:hypothetical protein
MLPTNSTADVPQDKVMGNRGSSTHEYERCVSYRQLVLERNPSNNERKCTASIVALLKTCPRRAILSEEPYAQLCGDISDVPCAVLLTTGCQCNLLSRQTPILFLSIVFFFLYSVVICARRSDFRFPDIRQPCLCDYPWSILSGRPVAHH